MLEMMLRVRKQATRLVRGRSSLLYVIDWQSRMLWTMSTGEMRHAWPLDAGLAGYVARSGIPEIFAHARDLAFSGPRIMSGCGGFRNANGKIAWSKPRPTGLTAPRKLDTSSINAS